MDSIPRFQEWRQRIGTQDAPVISVVDDDESLRRSLKNFLRSVGFRVETFASAEEFLTSAERENTGCLVLDLRMTGMTGERPRSGRHSHCSWGRADSPAVPRGRRRRIPRQALPR